MAGGPPVGELGTPYTYEGLVDLLDHLAALQANLPLSWRPWERTRLHGWARWVSQQGSKSGAMADWLVQHGYKVVGFGEHTPPRLALALTEADAPVAPEPPRLDLESALRTAPDAAWRSAWRAGWATGWVAGRESKP